MKTENFEKVKKRKLLAAVMIDAIGMSSFAFSVVGESADIVWGPISGLLIMMLFPNYKKNGLVGRRGRNVTIYRYTPDSTSGVATRV